MSERLTEINVIFLFWLLLNISKYPPVQFDTTEAASNNYLIGSAFFSFYQFTEGLFVTNTCLQFHKSLISKHCDVKFSSRAGTIQGIELVDQKKINRQLFEKSEEKEESLCLYLLVEQKKQFKDVKF